VTAVTRVMDLLQEGTSCLVAAGVDSPRFDAACLLALALPVEHNQIPLMLHDPVSADQRDRFQQYLQRRCQREPLQYITGKVDFFGRLFACDRRAMVPRPETELLVEAVTTYCQHHCPHAAIADIGTGAGVIAISLATMLPAAPIYATDISDEALKLTAENARLHSAPNRIELLCGPYLDPLAKMGVLAEVEVIVTNPPYVATNLFDDLQPEVRDFEPRPALDGGHQGLDFYAHFLPQCRQLPRLRLLATEIGIGQAGAVTRLVSEHLNPTEIEVCPDLAGISRVVLAYLDQTHT